MEEPAPFGLRSGQALSDPIRQAQGKLRESNGLEVGRGKFTRKADGEFGDIVKYCVPGISYLKKGAAIIVIKTTFGACRDWENTSLLERNTTKIKGKPTGFSFAVYSARAGHLSI